MYDYAVYIGRFQPFHNGHLKVLKKAFEIANHVIVVIGSTVSNERTLHDPFTFSERGGMIKREFSPDELQRLFFVSCEDVPGNDYLWAKRVTQDVRSVQICLPGAGVGGSVALIGHKKDESSFYLDMFPQWEFVEAGKEETLSATDIRKDYFAHGLSKPFEGCVPEHTRKFLAEFRHSIDWYRLYGETLYQTFEVELKWLEKTNG